MPVQSAFTLTAQDIYSSLANMIISQEVFADNLGKHQTLVDKARVDGSLFGDRKLYYSVDALKTNAWTKDSEAANLLSLARPNDPKVQAIVLDKFRQIRLTLDNYLTKRGFADEFAFSSFSSVMLGQMRETKRIYEGTLYNVYMGTHKGASNVNEKSITLSGTNDGQVLAQSLADLLWEMSDYSKDFNDYKFIRSYAPEDIKFVFNSKYVEKIKLNDTPSVLHRDVLLDKINGADVMQPRFFGTIITNSNKDDYADNTPTTGKPLDKDGNYAYTPGTANANGCVRSCVEVEVTVSGTAYHLFPGDEIPVGCKLATTSAAGTLLFGEVYFQEDKVIGVAYVKLPPFMSSFETATSFWNPRSLTETHFLTFGHNTISYLENYPLIRIKQA